MIGKSLAVLQVVFWETHKRYAAEYVFSQFLRANNSVRDFEHHVIAEKFFQS